MNEITYIAKKRMEYTLESLNRDLEVLSVRMAEARELGDLSENEEYTASMSEYNKKAQERASIEYTLKTSKVKQSYSTNITNGTLISVKRVVGDGVEDLGLQLFDDGGSALFSGIISSESALGREIQGGVGGEYVVQNIQGVDQKFLVTIEPESRLEEYLALYPPDRQEMISRIFEGLDEG